MSLAKTVPNFRTFKYVSCLVGYPCLGLLVLFWMPFKVDRYTRSIQCNRTFRYVEDIYREAFSAQALRMSTYIVNEWALYATSVIKPMQVKVASAGPRIMLVCSLWILKCAMLHGLGTGIAYLFVFA